MSDEPSYYEIALTNRQVLASFVVLLGCVLVAFGMGVWVGRMDGAPRAADGSPPATPASTPSPPRPAATNSSGLP